MTKLARFIPKSAPPTPVVATYPRRERIEYFLAQPDEHGAAGQPMGPGIASLEAARRTLEEGRWLRPNARLFTRSIVEQMID